MNVEMHVADCLKIMPCTWVVIAVHFAIHLRPAELLPAFTTRVAVTAFQ